MKKTKADYIVEALQNLGGMAPLLDIYEEVKIIHPEPHCKNFEESIRATIQHCSSNSQNYKHKKDLFVSVKGIGNGIWGLRSYITETPKACDINDKSDNGVPERTSQNIYRILRDTKLTSQLKFLYKHHCQLCDTRIDLANGNGYSEAHHIKPLGSPHNGLDVETNILILCPNHHVMLDYGAIKLDSNKIKMYVGHSINQEFIKYHNENIFCAN